MNLADLLELHRELYREDRRIPRLATASPPVTVDPRTGERQSTTISQLNGMTLSARLLRLVGHPENYGEAFPWSRALWYTKIWCRREHAYHRAADRPYWRGSLCHQAVKLTIIDGLSLPNSQRILRYDYLEPVLRAALAHIEAEMDRARDLAEQRAKHDAGVFYVGEQPAPAHHAVPGLHQTDCPICRKGAA